MTKLLVESLAIGTCCWLATGSAMIALCRVGPTALLWWTAAGALLLGACGLAWWRTVPRCAQCGEWQRRSLCLCNLEQE